MEEVTTVPIAEEASEVTTVPIDFITENTTAETTTNTYLEVICDTNVQINDSLQTISVLLFVVIAVIGMVAGLIITNIKGRKS